MYAWIWAHLPGPWPVRLLLTLVLIAAVVVLLFVVVFPWLDGVMPWGDVTVETGAVVGGQ